MKEKNSCFSNENLKVISILKINKRDTGFFSSIILIELGYFQFLEILQRVFRRKNNGRKGT
jgi:hypothetical protein